MLGKEVCHSSPTQGLKVIEPSFSTHGKKWVYATKDIVMSAVFLGRYGGDYTVKVGRNDEGIVYITERFKDAFKLRYSGKGSIYELSSEGFLENQTGWSEEVIKPGKASVVKEFVVDNIWNYLLKLEKENKLIIRYYPDRYMLPKDDEDLVRKTIQWVKQFGEEQLEMIKKYHPHLLDKVEEKLQKDR